ncbi:DUF411 domain-containing protein [Shewanella benthica]|uniref:CopG protein n=1 Tax=Shewanella benthica KT99 TaxID=314608 RepID=A9DBZ3_9GAMM|nr:DUF411 domain-containing protein [Shewanella benthica]EDQ00429.1 hypothetical protein KT99_11278 [Shewanella benthica KT99]
MASKNTLAENALSETKSSRLMPSKEGRISKKLMLIPLLMATGLLGAGAVNYMGREALSGNVTASKDAAITAQVHSLAVYKDPNCGCCGKWIDYMDNHGFDAKAHDTEQLSSLKQAKGIPANVQSCHTAISSQGFVFEGHIPATYVHQFLNDTPPGAIGLAVPAMPVGSPGMEYGDQFRPYQVLLLNKDGSRSVYGEVNSLEESVL